MVRYSTHKVMNCFLVRGKDEELEVVREFKYLEFNVLMGGKRQAEENHRVIGKKKLPVKKQ